MNILPKIDLAKEKKKIITFLTQTLKEQDKSKIVIGMSGGIDSMTAFYLLKEAVKPENIFIAHLYYFESKLNDFKSFLRESNIPDKNIYELSIKNSVDQLKQILNIPNEDKIRIGNIMARIRMIMLYDLAKKNNALVSGTEDKSEFQLGYFTRFGDQASDIELIRHLYKTQAYQLAKYLGVPERILNQPSSPDLWFGQTSEKELGFSYQEADVVLYLYCEKKLTAEEIKKYHLPNTEKIISWVHKNSFKHHLPYTP